ncbi:RNA polymerase sigma factor [Solibacillus merdavium]|uniref:RNA polymerase sigma factor n=1 Tax=Solibacillus merdavium TaxID=2762218 RepID=A0ABR8XQV5_9BACL|nr:sigma-70 family RNA polymerase sigma factor [Solibacillus merdavium]MBD8034325.1 sigma-70 family RNA polymerase sigma factor [Solibacillus merdavium]
MDKSWENYLLEEAQIVFKYLLKIGATKEDAEDVTQETIMKTIECLSQIQAKNLRAWLFKVALHRYYTLYNKNKRSVSLSNDEMQQFQSSLNIEEHLLIDEQNQTLHKALQGLSSTYQQLLIMKYFMDLSYKEMAAILDVSENHIRTYLQRARQALKKKWEDL